MDIQMANKYILRVCISNQENANYYHNKILYIPSKMAKILKTNKVLSKMWNIHF